MSVFYDIQEHIIIKDTAEHEVTFMHIKEHLIRLGAAMLGDTASITNLKVIADGEKREFSGKTVTEEYHNIVRAVSEAETLEIVVSYDYQHFVFFEYNPDPFVIADHLNKCIEKNGADSLNGVFYSMYNNADCSDTAGAVVAFGEKNGTFYTGNIEGKTVDTLPDGRWFSPNTTVVYDDDVDETKDIGEIESICDEMIQFRCDNTFDINEREFSFFLYDLILENNDEFNRFVGLCRKLLKATGGDAHASELRFTNFDSDDGQIATIKINDDGTQEIVLYSAE